MPDRRQRPRRRFVVPGPPPPEGPWWTIDPRQGADRPRNPDPDNEYFFLPAFVRPNFHRDDPVAAFLFLVITTLYYVAQYVNLPGFEALVTISNILFLVAMPSKAIKLAHVIFEKFAEWWEGDDSDTSSDEESDNDTATKS